MTIYSIYNTFPNITIGYLNVNNLLILIYTPNFRLSIELINIQFI